MLSYTYKDAVLNLLRGINATAPTLSLALYTGTVGSGPEVSGGSYARQPITFGLPLTDAPARVVRSDAEISFPEASTNWGTITHAKLIDGATVWATLTLEVPKAIEIADTAVFSVGDIELGLENA